jgi:hypothetical protein
MRPTPTIDIGRHARLLAGAVAAAMAVAVLVVVPGGAREASAAESPSSTGVLALRGGDIAATPELSSGSTAAWGYVVLNAWEHGRIAAIKAKSPNIKVLVYKDVSATVAYATTTTNGTTVDNTFLPAGVGYQWARANAPSWFLRDSSGQPIEWADFRGVWPMDVGNPAYQQKWLDNVLSEVRTRGWDGVMLDDTLTYLSHPTVGDVSSTQIPDDAAMLEATGAFLAKVGGGLKAAGYLAVPNITLHWRNWSSVLSSFSPSVSGWLVEYFVKWGLTSSYARMTGADWASRLSIVEFAQSQGAFVLPVTYGSADDIALQTYHRASWLLAWDGRGGASFFVPSQTSASHSLPDALTDLGAPVGARYAVASGAVWRRDYTGGAVLVNASTTSRTMALGASYRDATGAVVTSVTLPPATGALLRAVPGTTPPVVNPPVVTPVVTPPVLYPPPATPVVTPPPATPVVTPPAGPRSKVKIGKAVKVGRSGPGAKPKRLR